MKTTFKAILGSAALAAAISASGAALADREDIQLLSQAKVSLVDAIEKAEAHQGGKAVEANLDDDSFKPAYEVSIVKDNRLFDVQVDAVSGDVIGAREDLDD